MLTLETARTLLRPMHLDDWPAYAAFMGSKHSVFMCGPMDERASWGMFCSDVAQWNLMGHGALMMEDRCSGVCIGQVGINFGPLFPEHELGWFLYPEFTGKGYAMEAALALRKWAFEVHGLTSLVSYIDPKNLRSRNLAERLGAKPDLTAARPDPADLVYRHPCPN